MNFTRTDANALLAIALGSAIGMATLGPQAWLANELTTTTTTTYTTYGATSTRAVDENGIDEIVVDVDAPGRTESQTQIRVRRMSGTGVVVDGSDASDLQPIIYVDGVRFDGGLPDLGPDDIDRIEVVKGEAALERFGPDAAHGVVQIFLKEPASPNPGG